MQNWVVDELAASIIADTKLEGNFLVDHNIHFLEIYKAFNVTIITQNARI